MTFLLHVVEQHKASPEKQTEDGIMLLNDDIMTATGLNHYQQRVAKRKLETKGVLYIKYRDIPRKIYYKPNFEVANPILAQR